MATGLLILIWCPASALGQSVVDAGVPDSIHAQPPAAQLPPDLGCGSSVDALLAEWETTGETFQEPGGLFGERAWRLATRRLGTWVVVTVDASSMPTLARYDAGGTHLVRFGPSCAQIQSQELAPPNATSADRFSDDELETLVSDGAKGVIYVWSPHMPLSVDAFRHVASATEALGVALTVVVDPAGDPAYARAMARSAEMPVQAVRPFSSVELLFRNATVHAPSVLVYADRRILGLAIPGYRDATGYRTIIQQRLED